MGLSLLIQGKLWANQDKLVTLAMSSANKLQPKRRDGEGLDTLKILKRHIIQS